MSGFKRTVGWASTVFLAVSSLLWPGMGADPAGAQAPLIQVPIDRAGNRATQNIERFYGVDFATVGVMLALSPGAPPRPDPAPARVSINLAVLGLRYVSAVYLATESTYAFDLPNGVQVATLFCDYADGGLPTALPLVMGANTAEWSYENAAMAAALGPPRHSLPPIAGTAPVVNEAGQTFQAHTYFTGVNLDRTRTLSGLRLELVDSTQLAGFRVPQNSEPTWLGQANMAVTLEGPGGQPPGSAAGPSGGDPWTDPRLIACMDQVLAEMMAQLDRVRPDEAPHWVDQWGNLANKGYVTAQAPDDWITRWEGKKYKRICCGWDEASKRIFRERCGCSCDGAAVAGRTTVGGPPTPVPPTPGVRTGEPGGFTFYAVYQKLLGPDPALGAGRFATARAALSRDGRKIVAYGDRLEPKKREMIVMNSDGSDAVRYDLPPGVTAVEELIVNGDGSRAFIHAYPDHSIYKLEGGRVVKVFEPGAASKIYRCSTLRTTDRGDYVYFVDSASDIYRVAHGGGRPERVLRPGDIQRNGGKGLGVTGYLVSADGGTIAAIISGYVDSAGSHWKADVFAVRGGSARQLTDDPGNVLKGFGAVSPDGRTLVYSAGSKWRSVRADGSGRAELLSAGFNYGGMAFNGRRFFYCDAAAGGGRVVDVDEAGPVRQSLCLFPGWNVATIALAAPTVAGMGGDGQSVAFICDGALYFGRLNDPQAFPGAPAIRSIGLARAPQQGQRKASVTVTAAIAAGQDPAIKRTHIDVMAGGNWPAKRPISLLAAPRDDGQAPDVGARDGVFTSYGEFSDAPPGPDVAIRVSAQDGRFTVVADKPLGE